jgi:hypothetical protein
MYYSGNSMPISEMQPCKRDLEGDAKRLLASIKETQKSIECLEHLLSQFINDKRCKDALLIMFADKTLVLPQQEAEYDRLLEQIEKEGV